MSQKKETRMKPAPYKRLLDEASELGIDIEGFDYTISSTAKLKQLVEEKRAEKAKQREENPTLEDAIGETEALLIRVVEWTEWIPARPSEHESRLATHQGITAVETGKGEKLIDVQTTRLGQMKEIDEGDDKKSTYGLYAFQATLAQNASVGLAKSLIVAQGGDRDGSVRQPNSPIVQASAMPAVSRPGPKNRKDRRQR